MAIARLYIGDVKSLLKSVVTGDLFDVHSIKILESKNYASGYELIDIQKLSMEVTFVETHKARPEENHCWYKIQFAGDPVAYPDQIFAETEPLLPERLGNYVDTLRKSMSDYDSGKETWEPAFSDDEYIQALRTALLQHKGTMNLAEINDADWFPLQLLIRSHLSMVIAFDHAKYYQLQLANYSYDMSTIQRNYQSYAQEADRAYREITGRLNMGSGGFGDDGIIDQMPSPRVSDMRRFSHRTGLMVTSATPTVSLRRKRAIQSSYNEDPYA